MSLANSAGKLPPRSTLVPHAATIGGAAARRSETASLAVAAVAMAAKMQALSNTCVGFNPAAKRKPPSGAAAMPPSRRMPSAQPIALFRMRAG